MREEPNSSGSEGAVRTLPINLLLKDRLCLLVGAGHVAHRKLSNLLDHGARVVLVAPVIQPRVRELAELPNVEVRESTYKSALLDELSPFLVYAATNDDALNVRITGDARSRGMLASSVSSWRAGDFISPSVLRWGRGQVSITTEGASCRQAKFMRIRLEDLLGGDRELVMIGVDVRTLGYDAFARVRPDAERVEALIGMLRHLAALEEFALLATCNRLELYAFTRDDAALRSAVLSILGLDSFAERVTCLTGEEVVTHAVDVVAGHLSEVVCETEITAQFKAAFQRAFAENVAGVHLQNLHDRVLRLAKRVRALHGVPSRGLASLVLAETMGKGRVLLVGAGPLGSEFARASAESGAPGFTWANRTVERIPDDFEGPRSGLAEALADLGAYDVVISAVGAGRPIIRREHVGDLVGGLALPPLLIDLGMPRNVSPAVRDLPGVDVLTLEDFRAEAGDRDRLTDLTRNVADTMGGVLHG